MCRRFRRSFSLILDGLHPDDYLRHFLIGLLFPTGLAVALWDTEVDALMLALLFVALVNTLVFPYALYACRTVFPMARPTASARVAKFWRCVVATCTVTLCWTFAVVVAPVGLAVLYVRDGTSHG